MMNATFDGLIGLILVFIASELGQRMNDAFEEIGTDLDELDWYLFPIEIKRMLPRIIANAQQPVTLECFGSIACTREIFRKVSAINQVNRWNQWAFSFLLTFHFYLGPQSRLFVFYGAQSTWRLKAAKKLSTCLKFTMINHHWYLDFVELTHFAIVRSFFSSKNTTTKNCRIFFSFSEMKK